MAYFRNLCAKYVHNFGYFGGKLVHVAKIISKIYTHIYMYTYIEQRLRLFEMRNQFGIAKKHNIALNARVLPIVYLNHLCAFIFTNWLENRSIVKIENEKEQQPKIGRKRAREGERELIQNELRIETVKGLEDTETD